MDTFRVLLVAGGKGTRSLDPSLPKILQEVAPGITILELHLQNFQKANLTYITLLLGFGSDRVILEAKKLQIKYPQLSLSWKVESSQQGTFLPVMSALQSLDENNCIVVLGDIVISADYKHLIKRWKDSSAEIAVVVHPNLHPQDSDRVIVNDNDLIDIFISKNITENIAHQRPSRSLAGVIFFTKKRGSNIRNLSDDITFNALTAEEIKLGVVAINSSHYFHDAGTAERIRKIRSDYKEGFLALRGSAIRAGIFLDRDGTIFKDLGTSRKSIYEDEITPALGESIRKANLSGIPIFVVSNQPGVAKGQLTINDPHRVQMQIEGNLLKYAAIIDDYNFCPHHPEIGFPGEVIRYKVKCNCRKPRPGMIEEIADKHGISLEDSFLIGDSDFDMEAARNAGIKFIHADHNGENFLRTDFAIDKARNEILT
jgi:histidinol-phosphate phosphatase family protein